MKEFIEKLIGRLEEEKSLVPYNRLLDTIEDKPKEVGQLMTYQRVIEIVNQLAEEHNNGWIPCSERLPEEKGDYLVTCNDGKVRIWWFVVEGDFRQWLSGVHQLKPIAWQPLPQTYKPKGE